MLISLQKIIKTIISISGIILAIWIKYVKIFDLEGFIGTIFIVIWVAETVYIIVFSMDNEPTMDMDSQNAMPSIVLGSRC